MKLTSSEMHLPLSSSPHVLYDSITSLLLQDEILSACKSKAGWKLVLRKKKMSRRTLISIWGIVATDLLSSGDHFDV